MAPPTTIPQLFFQAIDTFGTKRAALRHVVGSVWHDITHHQLAQQVHHVAIGLRELGIESGDRLAILSDNRPEWVVADYACMNLGAVDVAIYPTLTDAQIRYLLRDSGAVAIFVENEAQYRKVAAVKADLPDLRHIITFEPIEGAEDSLPLSTLMQSGGAAVDRHPDYRDRAMAVTADSLATLIYTSGTTGDPKGVMLTHGNFTSNVLTAVRTLPVGPDDSCLSLLPLSHSFERTAGNYVMFYAGTTINYARGIPTVAEDMLVVRPTVMVSVPRLYEKIHARIIEKAMAGGSISRRVFHWAQRVGREWTDITLAGGSVPGGLSLQKRLADRLVFGKLRARTGGRLRYFVSGGAPLSPEIATFFYSAGLPILEGYGLTETSPIITVNRLDRLRIGSVGLPIEGVDVRIAADGEICVRGPNIMRGYYNKPEATAEAIDQDGWFHTGDIGELDDEGFLKITDRKKDLIVTAGGKNIAPQPIEHLAKTSPFILNAVMLGDRRKFTILLVVPDLRAIGTWASHRKLSLPSTPADILAVPDVVAKVEREAMVNLRDLARFEMPKKIVLIGEDFTEARGELTPTLKVKRRVIEEHYREEIEQAYTGPAPE